MQINDLGWTNGRDLRPIRSFAPRSVDAENANILRDENCPGYASRLIKEGS